MCIIFIGFERCNIDAIMVWLTVALCLSAAYYSAIFVTVLDMTSNYIGIFGAIIISANKIVFCFAPPVIAYLTSKVSPILTFFYLKTIFLENFNRMDFLVLY